MQFLWQGAKTKIVSIIKHKKILIRQKNAVYFSLVYVSIFEKTKFSLSLSWVARSSYIKPNIEHFGLLCV